MVMLVLLFEGRAAKVNAAEKTLDVTPYLDMLVGPAQINAGESAVDTADLEAFVSYLDEAIEGRLEELALIHPDWEITYNVDTDALKKQTLAMTAVYRDYTFYNRYVCEWYADNLLDETLCYAEDDNSDEESAAGLMILGAGFYAGLGGLDGRVYIAWSSALAGLAGQFSSGHYTVETLSRSDLYETDNFTSSRVELSWDGWTDEKIAEVEELLKYDDETLMRVLTYRQEDSLLYSPVVLYKQGYAGWEDEPFGGGTIASDGCCPTAIAMVLSYFTGTEITPVQIAGEYNTDYYRNVNSGSYGARMCAGAGADYGITVVAAAEALTGEEIITALSQGAKIVMSMKPDNGGGRYASVYHYVVLAGLTDDGLVIVNNPGITTDVSYDDISVILANQSGRGYGIFYGAE